MHITKMHGLGNDFIVIEGRVDDASALARALCPRRLAVGADGLLLVEPSKRADVRMRIINADGSEAEMRDSILNVVDGWNNDMMIYPGHGDGCTMKTVRKINAEFNEIVNGR